MSNLKYNPLVTIIIPVYNGTNFMAEAIDSAIAQTYKNIEIIVVNDGSTDEGETEKLALSYGDRIRYISKENGGVSSALNLAIQNAKGEWFSWLSHDDLYYPNKIEAQITFINDLINQNPSIDLHKIVLHSATVSIDKNGKIIKKPNYKHVDLVEDSNKVVINNIIDYKLSGCSFLVPVSSFNDIGGFREDIRTVSDVEYWYRLIFGGYQFYCLKNNILVKNRSHGKQVGKTKVELFNRELTCLYNNIIDSYLSVFNPSSKDIKMFYCGMVKRGFTSIAKRIKNEVLKNKISKFDYYFCLPLRKLKWVVVGASRNFLRRVFRFLRVH